MPWYVNRRGERLWYEDQGTGESVLLLHGWCMSSVVWKCQFDALAASMRLLAPDLRGHGCSKGVSSRLDFRSFTEDLVDLFEALDLSRVVLIGWSMGAQIALQASAALSCRLAGLVLVSATPSFIATDDFPYGLARNEANGMRLKIQRSTRRALDGFHTRLFAKGELESDSLAAEIKQLLAAIPSPDTAAVLDALDALARTDMSRLLATISVPTLVVNGGLDRICLPQASSYLKEHIPDAVQTVFQDSGHAPFLACSDLFNAEIIRFTRSVREQNA